MIKLVFIREFFSFLFQAVGVWPGAKERGKLILQSIGLLLESLLPFAVLLLDELLYALLSLVSRKPTVDASGMRCPQQCCGTVKRGGIGQQWICFKLSFDRLDNAYIRAEIFKGWTLLFLSGLSHPVSRYPEQNTKVKEALKRRPRRHNDV